MEINKYHNSKIYKLVSNHTDKIYIGSTAQKYLTSRKAGHIAEYKKFKNNKATYTTSFELIDLGEIDIILIENFKCENKEELHAKERHYIELNKELCVNMCIPSRTKKEYREKNKENIKEYMKEYYEKNKEKIKEYEKEYREKNQEYQKEYEKEYYEKNKEHIKEKIKEYRENNKEKLNEKLNCECGGKFNNSNKSRHLKSKKHLNFINTNQ
jgi:hypothetical protein